jgi:enoyl-CoA hydratase/carnithine racemase
MSKLDGYKSAFETIRFARERGVLEVTLHTNGGPLILDERSHRDFSQAFQLIAADPENLVVILTGTGDRFCADFDYGSFDDVMAAGHGDFWLRIRRDGHRMLTAFLEIEVPVIAAINGPAVSHSELPLLSDVVLAADHTVFRDATHFVAGIPPGDGMHIVWTTLLGLNRGRYFLMTGQTMTALEALDAGVVAEVLPSDSLLDRARSLARLWADLPKATLIGTRSILTAEWKRKLAADLHSGLTYEAQADLSSEKRRPHARIIDLLNPN